MSLKLLSGEDDSALEAGHHRLVNTDWCSCNTDWCSCGHCNELSTQGVPLLPKDGHF